MVSVRPAAREVRGSNTFTAPSLARCLSEARSTPKCAGFISHILCSRHNPKILRIDDTKIIGDQIAEVRPVSRDFFS